MLLVFMKLYGLLVLACLFLAIFLWRRPKLMHPIICLILFWLALDYVMNLLDTFGKPPPIRLLGYPVPPGKEGQFGEVLVYLALFVMHALLNFKILKKLAINLFLLGLMISSTLFPFSPPIYSSVIAYLNLPFKPSVVNFFIAASVFVLYFSWTLWGYKKSRCESKAVYS